MLSVDQNITAKAVEQAKDVPVPDDDIELLVRTGIKLLKQGGLEVIKKAIDSSSDPGQVVGQFMAQLILKMGEDFIEQLQVDPRAFLAKGGFLEELLDYLETSLRLPPEFSDEVYAECVQVIKAVVLSRGAKGPQQPQQPPGIDQMGASV